eukprot:10224316-Alexandrium_andersonii.AAC.1
MSQSITGWSTGISPWIRSCSASIEVRINPLSCLAALIEPLGCGSYSRTVCTPRRSATARRRSTNAGSLSVLSKIRRRCPSRRILATAWPT